MTFIDSLSGLDRRDMVDVIERSAHLAGDLRNARIVITGATGWFGTWLLDALVALNRWAGLGLRIVAVSRAPEAFFRKWPELFSAAEIDWIVADVRDRTLDVPGRVTHVIHAATDSHSTMDDAELIETIVEGTRNVLLIAARHSHAKTLLVSSGAVYGDQPAGMQRLPESYGVSTGPVSAYGEGKRSAERLAVAMGGELGIHASIARCFAFVGPHMPFDAHFAIGNFIRDAVAGREVHVRGDGEPLRSYQYMSDLVVWLLTILVHGRPLRPYNVGGDEVVSIASLARKCAGRAANRLPVRIGNASSGGSDYVPDLTRAMSELGLSNRMSLDDALFRTAGWLRTQPLDSHMASTGDGARRSSLGENARC